MLGVVTNGMPLPVLNLIDIDDFSQFFESVLHAYRHFILLL
jgi:hypothetical protein